MLTVTCYLDMQRNPTMIHPHTPIRVAIIQEPVMPSIDQDVEQQKLSLIAGGNVNVVPSKTKHTLATTRSSNCAPDHQLRH